MPTSFQAERHGPIPAVNQDLFTKALDGCEVRPLSLSFRLRGATEHEANAE